MLQYTLTEQRRRRRRLCPSALCVKKYCAAAAAGAAGAACSTRLAQRRRVAIRLDVYPHYTRRWGAAEARERSQREHCYVYDATCQSGGEVRFEKI